MTQATVRRTGKSRFMWWIVGFLALAVIGVHLLSDGEIVTLRAVGPLPVGASPVLPPTGGNLIHTLSAGEDAHVIECKDIKTDLVIRLRTRAGGTGYVAAGNYILLRKKAGLSSLLLEFDLVTFSCRGMFENRSRSVQDEPKAGQRGRNE